MSAHSDSTRAVSALRGLLSDYEHAVTEAVEAGGREAELAARQTTDWKDRSGKTRKSIRFSLIKNGRGFKLTGKGMSLFLEGGTSAHVISATGDGSSSYSSHVRMRGGVAVVRSTKTTKPKMLRFVIGNRVFYRRSVYHPGTKATFFLERAVVEGAQTVARNLPRLFSRAAQRRGLGG